MCSAPPLPALASRRYDDLAWCQPTRQENNRTQEHIPKPTRLTIAGSWQIRRTSSASRRRGRLRGRRRSWLCSSAGRRSCRRQFRRFSRPRLGGRLGLRVFIHPEREGAVTVAVIVGGDGIPRHHVDSVAQPSLERAAHGLVIQVVRVKLACSYCRPVSSVTVKLLSVSLSEISSLKTSVTFAGALASLASAAGSDETSLACASGAAQRQAKRQHEDESYADVPVHIVDLLREPMIQGVSIIDSLRRRNSVVLSRRAQCPFELDDAGWRRRRRARLGQSTALAHSRRIVDQAASCRG